MADSLRDQLLKSGLVQKLKAEAKPAPKPAKPTSSPVAKKNDGEMDLAQAYAARARNEREERERAQREAERQAREKRERRERIANLLQNAALNVTDAEHPRHFPHGAKIRRVYCTTDQLAAVNRGDIGVVQQNGRYLLVSRALALKVQAISAEAVVLLADPNAPPEDDVPADLVW